MLEQELLHTKKDLEASVQRESQLQLQVQSRFSVRTTTAIVRDAQGWLRGSCVARPHVAHGHTRAHHTA